MLRDFFEAAAIVFFFVLSEWVQKWCVHHTAQQTGGLGGLLPETVTLEGGVEKPLDEVLVGEVVLVKPGERVPVDGTVVGEGSSSVDESMLEPSLEPHPEPKPSPNPNPSPNPDQVDESMLTGEAVPVRKAAGAAVTAGTTNQSGVLTVRVDAAPADSMAAQLTQLVADAQQQEAKREAMLERFAKVYTLCVVFAAVMLAAVPQAFCRWESVEDGHADGHADDGHTGHAHGGRQLSGGPGGGGVAMCEWWLHRAVALVVTACPCSLVVAMPITYACGIAGLARWGILVKSSRQMELLAKVRTLALDKTGTLTEGKFRLLQMGLGGTTTTERAMQLAAGVEAVSSHPIAAAFLDFAQSLAVEPPPCTEFELLEGEGVVGTVDGVRVHVGSERLARRVLGEREAEEKRKERAAMPRRMREALERVEAEEAQAEAKGQPQPQAQPQEAKGAEKGDAQGGEKGAPAPPLPTDAEEACGGGDCCATGECGGGGGMQGGAALRLDSALPAKWKRDGSTVLWMLLDGEIAAACRLADRVRADSGKAVRALKELGITPVMLTGDHAITARAVCASVGIAQCHAGMKPQEKLEQIKLLKADAVVGMIGDGVNDGPALAVADVGVAIDQPDLQPFVAQAATHASRLQPNATPVHAHAQAPAHAHAPRWAWPWGCRAPRWPPRRRASC